MPEGPPQRTSEKFRRFEQFAADENTQFRAASSERARASSAPEVQVRRTVSRSSNQEQPLSSADKFRQFASLATPEAVQTDRETQALIDSWFAAVPEGEKDSRGEAMRAVMEKHNVTTVEDARRRILEASEKMAQLSGASTGAEQAQALQGTFIGDLSQALGGSAPAKLVENILQESASKGDLPPNVARFKRTGRWGDAVLGKPVVAKGGEVLTSMMNVGPVTTGAIGTALAAGVIMSPATTASIVAALLATDLMTKSGMRGKIVEKGSVRGGAKAFYVEQPFRALAFTLASCAAIYMPTKALVRADVDTLTNSQSAGGVRESAEKLRKPLLESGKVMERYIRTLRALETAIPGIECGADVSGALKTIADGGISVAPGTRHGAAKCGPLAIKKYYVTTGKTNDIAKAFPSAEILPAAGAGAANTVKSLVAQREALGLAPGEAVSARVESMWKAYLQNTRVLRKEGFLIIDELGKLSSDLDQRTFTKNITTTILRPLDDLQSLLEGSEDLGTDERQLLFEQTLRKTLDDLSQRHGTDPKYQELLKRLNLEPGDPENTPGEDTLADDTEAQKERDLVREVQILLNTLFEKFDDLSGASKYKEALDEWVRDVLGDEAAQGIIDAGVIQRRADRLSEIFKEINESYAQVKGEIDTLSGGVESLLATVDEGVRTEAPGFSLPSVQIADAKLPPLTMFMAPEELEAYIEKHGEIGAITRITAAALVSAILNFFFLLITLRALAASGRRAEGEVDENLPKVIAVMKERTEGMANSINAMFMPYIQEVTGSSPFSLTDPQQTEYLLRQLARKSGQSVHVPGVGPAIDKMKPNPNSLQQFSEAVANMLTIWRAEAPRSLESLNLLANNIRSLEGERGLNRFVEAAVPGGMKWLNGSMSEGERTRAVAQALTNRSNFLSLRIQTANEMLRHLETVAPSALKDKRLDLSALPGVGAVNFDPEVDKHIGIVSYLQQIVSQDEAELENVRKAFRGQLNAYTKWHAEENASQVFAGNQKVRALTIPKSMSGSMDTNLTADPSLIEDLYAKALKSTEGDATANLTETSLQAVATEFIPSMQRTVETSFPQLFASGSDAYNIQLHLSTGTTSSSGSASFVFTVKDTDNRAVGTYVAPVHAAMRPGTQADDIRASLENSLRSHLVQIGNDAIRDSLAKEVEKTRAETENIRTRFTELTTGKDQSLESLTEDGIDALLLLRDQLVSQEVRAHSLEALMQRKNISVDDLKLIGAADLLAAQRSNTNEIRSALLRIRQDMIDAPHDRISLSFNFITDEFVVRYKRSRLSSAVTTRVSFSPSLSKDELIRKVVPSS